MLFRSNLANMNTSGYKKETIIARSFPEMLLHRINDSGDKGKPPVVGTLTTGLQLDEISIDYTKGVLKETGNPSDLALSGEGYFTVNTPQGERYTRNGVFQPDAEGKLVTADGYPLLGQKGEILVGNNPFTIDSSGKVFVGETELDQLKIVTFTNGGEKQGSSLFNAPDPQELANPKVLQGFMEESNVNPIEEMVNMINIMRAYEANQKVIQTHDSTLDKAVNEVGRI